MQRNRLREMNMVCDEANCYVKNIDAFDKPVYCFKSQQLHASRTWDNPNSEYQSRIWGVITKPRLSRSNDDGLLRDIMTVWRHASIHSFFDIVTLRWRWLEISNIAIWLDFDLSFLCNNCTSLILDLDKKLQVGSKCVREESNYQANNKKIDIRNRR